MLRVVDFYNEMTSNRSRCFFFCWRAARITDAIRLGSKNLPPIDPFHDIDPLLDDNTTESQQLQAICGLTLEENRLDTLQQSMTRTVMILIGRDLQSMPLWKVNIKKPVCLLIFQKEISSLSILLVSSKKKRRVKSPPPPPPPRQSRKFILAKYLRKGPSRKFIP